MRNMIALTALAAVLLTLGSGTLAAHRREREASTKPRHAVLATPFGGTMAVCAGQFIPNGWALADTQTNLASCGGDSVNNVWVLVHLKGAEHGQTATLCLGPVPEGWVATGRFTDTTRCGGNLAGVFDNLMTVSKL
jgi:hypothetical protein